MAVVNSPRRSTGVARPVNRRLAASVELSTDLGRASDSVDLLDLVLEPDEGLILRLSEDDEGGNYPHA
jgi:hypothetical protein